MQTKTLCRSKRQRKWHALRAIPVGLISEIVLSWSQAMQIANEPASANRIRAAGIKRGLQSEYITGLLEIEKLLMGKYSPLCDEGDRAEVARECRRVHPLNSKNWKRGISEGLKHPAFRHVLTDAARRGDIDFFAALGSAVATSKSGSPQWAWQHLSKVERYLISFWIEAPPDSRPLSCMTLKDLEAHVRSEVGLAHDRDALRQLRNRLGLLSVEQCLERRLRAIRKARTARRRESVRARFV